MSVTRFQRIIIIIVILSSLLLWNCWNCPIWCLMTCVHFSNYLIHWHCLIWPIPIEIDATWCIFCDWVTGKPLYINIFVFKVDSSSRTIVWRYFQSSVSPPHLTCLALPVSPGQPGAVLRSTPKLHHQVNHVYGFIVRSLHQASMAVGVGFKILNVILFWWSANLQSIIESRVVILSDDAALIKITIWSDGHVHH